jgi:hypothetical protein
VVAEPELRAQASVIEATDDVITPSLKWAHPS